MTHYPLTVTRNSAWYGRARALMIYAQTPSGKVKLGKVKSGKSVTVNVPNDAEQLYGKMDWGSSLPLDLAFISAGETVYANLWFTLNPLKIFAITGIPCAIETQPR